MKVGNYKVNSSVIIASLIAFISAAADLLSDGLVVATLAEVIVYFLGKPDAFAPYMSDKIYQGALTFLPVLLIILRMHKAQGRPPIEKIEKHE